MPELMKCGGERKFVVIKIADIDQIGGFRQVRLENNLAELLDDIQERRSEDGRNPNPEYLVINTDEPYASEVIEIMKRHGHWGPPQEAGKGNSMKIYRFEGKEWPYTATICAESAEQASGLYNEDVCTPDENNPWRFSLPAEITREIALSTMSDFGCPLGQTAVEYLDEMMLEGACVIAIDSALV